MEDKIKVLLSEDVVDLRIKRDQTGNHKGLSGQKDTFDLCTERRRVFYLRTGKTY